VKVSTTRFGELEVAEGLVYELPSPLPGFPNTKHFFFIQRENIQPFQWMQSVEEPELTFVVVEPGNFFHDYVPDIPKFELRSLGLENLQESLLLVICVLPEDMTKMTANLRGPLIVNPKDRKMKQVFLETDLWSVRESILDGIKKKEQMLLEQRKKEEAQA
jgi:flagellar assembly factor FliW